MWFSVELSTMYRPFLQDEAGFFCDGLAASLTSVVFDGMRTEGHQGPVRDAPDRLEEVAARLECVLKRACAS
jgi:hypothetical protein